MDKKDIAELKKRFTIKSHNIDRIAGCYVNSEGEKINTFSVSPMELEGDEFLKYLEIAKKCLSGRTGNNLMYLEFAPDEAPGGEAYEGLKNVLDTSLKDDSSLNDIYDRIISSLEKPENHLILLFHDVYDIPQKSRDNADLDESENVFRYMLCAICQVKLPKGALGYVEDEERIGELKRDWTVAMPDAGFIFPAFSERCGDYSHVIAYTKNAKEPPVRLWEEGLHITPALTSVQKLGMFEKLLTDAEPDNEKLAEVMPNVADGISAYIANRKAMYPEDGEPGIDSDEVKDICISAGMDDEKADKVAAGFDNTFTEEKDIPEAADLLDRGLLKGADLRRKNRALQREVARLRNNGTEASDGASVIVTMSQDSDGHARIAEIEGTRCLVIPVDDKSDITVNGSPVE